MMQNSVRIQELTTPKRVILVIFDINDAFFTLLGNVFVSK